MAFPDVEILNPHFDLPFRFQGGKAAVVEQDSLDDIANCVYQILGYEKGTRLMDDRAEFGIEAPLFEITPVDTTGILEDIEEQETRARVSITGEVDSIDSLITKIQVNTWDT